jgi:hypothetical protein
MFGAEAVLVAAIRLVGLPGITLDEAPDEVCYYHLALDDHQVIYAEDAPTESFRITRTSLASLTEEGREELLTLFPDLCNAHGPARRDAALIPPRPRQKSLIRRMIKNRKPVVATAA